MHTIEDKAEIIRQWNNDPCGGIQGVEPGTSAYYSNVDYERYVNYAPWMPKIMRFDQFAGKKLLEVGFGQGTDLFQFAKNGAVVSGIDITPRHYQLARRRFELAGIPADLRLGDAEAMPFADESFDAVYSFGVIHHSPNTQQIIDEIHRVLKPGGRAIIGVYHTWSAYNLFNFLVNYLLKLRVLRESFRKHMSRIEHRENSDACPLVKTYGKRQFGRMLCRFTSTEIVIAHLTRRDISRAFGFQVPDALALRLEPYFGWYLIALCVK
jgi:ubiquinone/menaquinone biosynthesis C-methylase UbiE